jgi:putative methionine-R-sulfoxide reductase with GAF domain
MLDTLGADLLPNRRIQMLGKRGSYSGVTEGGILSDQQVRLETVPIGIWLTAIVSIGAAVYALVTWDQPHRDWLIGIAIAGLLTAPLIQLMPWKRIVKSRHRELFFLTWSGVDVLFIGTSAALDGGSQSPFVLLLVLPLLFASLSYPLRETIFVAASILAVFVALAFGIGGGVPYSGLGAFAMICIGLLSFWEASTQSDRRHELAGIAKALRASESTSWIQAQQQREVASFGQLALGGADTDALQAEAVRLVAGTLDIEVAGVLKIEPGGEEFSVAAGVGLPEGEVRVPAGYDSQSGYALATGSATVVSDWSQEGRFRQSPMLADLGTKSGVSVLIKAKGRPYGVLGVQSLRLRQFTGEDVSFLQAIANILANAI